MSDCRNYDYIPKNIPDKPSIYNLECTGSIPLPIDLTKIIFTESAFDRVRDCDVIGLVQFDDYAGVLSELCNYKSYVQVCGKDYLLFLHWIVQNYRKVAVPNYVTALRYVDLQGNTVISCSLLDRLRFIDSHTTLPRYHLNCEIKGDMEVEFSCIAPGQWQSFMSAADRSHVNFYIYGDSNDFVKFVKNNYTLSDYISPLDTSNISEFTMRMLPSCIKANLGVMGHEAEVKLKAEKNLDMLHQESDYGIKYPGLDVNIPKKHDSQRSTPSSRSSKQQVKEAVKEGLKEATSYKRPSSNEENWRSKRSTPVKTVQPNKELVFVDDTIDKDLLETGGHICTPQDCTVGHWCPPTCPVRGYKARHQPEDYLNHVEMCNQYLSDRANLCNRDCSWWKNNCRFSDHRKFTGSRRMAFDVIFMLCLIVVGNTVRITAHPLDQHVANLTQQMVLTDNLECVYCMSDEDGCFEQYEYLYDRLKIVDMDSYLPDSKCECANFCSCEYTAVGSGHCYKDISESELIALYQDKYNSYKMSIVSALMEQKLYDMVFQLVYPQENGNCLIRSDKFKNMCRHEFKDVNVFKCKDSYISVPVSDTKLRYFKSCELQGVTLEDVYQTVNEPSENKEHVEAELIKEEIRFNKFEDELIEEEIRFEKFTFDQIADEIVRGKAYNDRLDIKGNDFEGVELEYEPGLPSYVKTLKTEFEFSEFDFIMGKPMEPIIWYDEEGNINYTHYVRDPFVRLDDCVNQTELVILRGPKAAQLAAILCYTIPELQSIGTSEDGIKPNLFHNGFRLNNTNVTLYDMGVRACDTVYIGHLSIFNISYFSDMHVDCEILTVDLFPLDDVAKQEEPDTRYFKEDASNKDEDFYASAREYLENLKQRTGNADEEIKKEFEEFSDVHNAYTKVKENVTEPVTESMEDDDVVVEDDDIEDETPYVFLRIYDGKGMVVYDCLNWTIQTFKNRHRDVSDFRGTIKHMIFVFKENVYSGKQTLYQIGVRSGDTIFLKHRDRRAPMEESNIKLNEHIPKDNRTYWQAVKEGLEFDAYIEKYLYRDNETNVNERHICLHGRQMFKYFWDNRAENFTCSDFVRFTVDLHIKSNALLVYVNNFINGEPFVGKLPANAYCTWGEYAEQLARIGLFSEGGNCKAIVLTNNHRSHCPYRIEASEPLLKAEPCPDQLFYTTDEPVTESLNW